MNIKNGSEVPGDGLTGLPGASRKAATRRGQKKGVPANQPDKPKRPRAEKGASPSAATVPAEQMHRSAGPGRQIRGSGTDPQGGAVFSLALARREAGGRGEAGRGSPDAGDPEAILRCIVAEDWESDESGMAADSLPACAPERDAQSRGSGSGSVGVACGLANGGSGGGLPAAASPRWRRPLTGTPDPMQGREALDVFVKLSLGRLPQAVIGMRTNAVAYGAGHLLWSLSRSGRLASDAEAFVTLRRVFGADGNVCGSGSDDVLPCNRRTVIHALRHAGLLDPSLSVRVLKPAHLIPGFLDAMQAVSHRFGCSAGEIAGTRRSKQVAEARFAVMAVRREVSGVSCARIGIEMGGRHHSSVMHAIRSMEERRRTDPDLDRKLALCVDDADDALLERHVDLMRRSCLLAHTR